MLSERIVFYRLGFSITKRFCDISVKPLMVIIMYVHAAVETRKKPIIIAKNDNHLCFIPVLKNVYIKGFKIIM